MKDHRGRTTSWESRLLWLRVLTAHATRLALSWLRIAGLGPRDTTAHRLARLGVLAVLVGNQDANQDRPTITV